MTVTSNDITSLLVKSTFDISGTTPVISLENLSTGVDLAACTWWFIATAPGNIPIYEGSETSPDITGNWSTFDITDNWPKAFNNILWSGAPYILQTFVKDGDGNIFTISQSASICRPQGNKSTSTNTYGLATCLLEVKCDQGRVFFQDTTNSTYKGIEGTIGASVLRVFYPVDETGNVPAPFVGANFSTALVPITYSSDNYSFQSYSIYDYDFGDYVHIRIRYQSFNPVNGAPAVRFAVLCNVDLCALFCEVDKLVRDIDSGNCVNVQEAQEKLNRINPKLFLILMGVQQPLCGVDVPALIEEVKLIGGFTCDCCNAPTGIIPTNASIIDGYNFSVVTECGDTTGEFAKTGNNIQLLLSGLTYTFAFCNESPAQTTAFTFEKDVSGCVAAVCLNVDVTQLGYDLAAVIGGNGALLNVWQTLIGSSSSFDLIVDGGCIFQSTSTCDYDFTLSAIPINTTYALLSSLTVSGVTHSLSFSFNLTNLSGLQGYLNSLGYGTFTVTNPSGQIVLISTVNNSNNLQSLTYKISGTTYLADLSRTCTGYVPISANQVVQNIINYICGLGDTQIETSSEYTICYIDPVDGTSKTQIIQAGSALTTFITALLARGCDTISYIEALNTPDCDGMKTLFPSSVAVMQANDYLFGTKAGSCARVLPIELGTRQLELGATNPDYVAAFCALVSLCGGGLPCEPYDVFNVVVDDASPSGINLVFTFDHPSAVSNIISYARIDNTVSPVYTTVTGILPGASPYTIPALDNGQYRVKITPVYSDGRLCSATSVDTPACTGINSLSSIFNGTDIIISYNASVSVPSVRVTIAYPNGGSSTAIYTNTGDDISFTPPLGVVGTYFITMQPVCDVDSGFFGVATAPVSVSVFSANVTIQNINPTGGSVKRITSVSGITGFALSGNVETGEQQIGIHSAFTGSITVSVQQVSSGSNSLKLYVNSVEIECIDVNAGAIAPVNHTFSSASYLDTDIIVITYDAGVCDSSPTANYFINAAYNLSIDTVTGAGVSPLGSTGVNGNKTGQQTGMSSNYSITISGTVPGIPLVIHSYVNSVEFSCVAITVVGGYSLPITALSSDTVLIAIDSGTC